MLLFKLSYIFYDMLDKILKSEIIEVLLIFPKRENIEVGHFSEFARIMTIKKSLSARLLSHSFEIIFNGITNIFFNQNRKVWTCKCTQKFLRGEKWRPTFVF